MTSNTLAFPEAVGYGATTVGGRGGAVVIVTNLNDDGPGSLRWALEDVKGPRTVVFEVSGAINLKSQILIQDPFVTIAGQSAPGEGITIEGARIRVKADEVIVRGLHFRPGDGEGGQAAGDRDGLFIGTTDFEINNVIVDHNTFTWAVDENLAVNGHVRDISISNNIIAQGLSNSIHPNGEHSKGLLISNWDGAADWASNISVVGNLFAGNQQRNPEVRSGQNVEIVNNLIYDYGLGRAAIAVGGGNNGTLATSVFIIGNVMMAGPDTSGAAAPIAISAMGEGSAIYLADNLWQARGQTGFVDQSRVAFAWDAGGLRYLTTQGGGSGLDVLAATDVLASVLANAGASPFDRDAIDARIVELVRTGGSMIVDSVAEAGGRAPVTNASAAADFDRDGMPDWFESLYGMDSRTFSANGDLDGDGYTNVEEYLNGLITGFDLPLSTGLVASAAGVAGVADVFRADLQTLRAPVHLTGMNAAEGDRIDISALLATLPASATSVADYVDVRVVDGKTVVFFDADGKGSNQQARVVAVADGLVPVSLPSTARPQAPLPAASVVREQHGSDGADRLRGDARTDHLFGRAGNDILDGGAGADRMAGGLGDDSYTVDNVGDIVVESAGEGTDTVSASVSFTLANNVENLTLTGLTALAGTGNALNNKLVGNAAANLLVGLAGDDSLMGGAGDDRLEGGEGKDRLDGGLGADRMDGGAGDDTYFVDNLRDVIVERAGGGVDSVTASVSHILAAEVENLNLSGLTNIDATGNAQANRLIGNAGENRLVGLGGADDLRGGAGRDFLDGGAGNDKLDGGLGADVLLGGLGDDSYFIDDLSDTATEFANEGADMVSASVTWTLGANFETLALSGLRDISGTGNDLHNRISGNAGANTLSGLGGNDDLNGGAGDDWLIGGAGKDILTGGAGADVFVFGTGDAALDGARLECVTDFQRGIDQIRIEWSSVDGPVSTASLQISGNSYQEALAAAESTLSGVAQAIYISGSSDAWLFWDDPATAATIDGAILLKNGAVTGDTFFPAPSEITFESHPSTTTSPSSTIPLPLQGGDKDAGPQIWVQERPGKDLMPEALAGADEGETDPQVWGPEARTKDEEARPEVLPGVDEEFDRVTDTGTGPRVSRSGADPWVTLTIDEAGDGFLTLPDGLNPTESEPLVLPGVDEELDRVTDTGTGPRVSGGGADPWLPLTIDEAGDGFLTLPDGLNPTESEPLVFPGEQANDLPDTSDLFDPILADPSGQFAWTIDQNGLHLGGSVPGEQGRDGWLF